MATIAGRRVGRLGITTWAVLLISLGGPGADRRRFRADLGRTGVPLQPDALGPVVGASEPGAFLA